MTGTTLPLLLITIILLSRPPVWIISALMAYMIMEDAAMLMIGSTPLNVSWFALIMVTLRIMPSVWPIYARDFTNAWKEISPLVVLLLYGLLAILLSLAFFYKQIDIMPGSVGFQRAGMMKFDFVPEHTRQNMYMFLMVGCLAMLLLYMFRLSTDEVDRLLTRMFLIGAAAASTMAIWDWGADLMPLPPFPNDFFHSDRTIGAFKQGFGGVRRIAGSFSEPSALAEYCAPMLFYLSTRCVFEGKPIVYLLLGAVVFSLLISTSTGGYAMTALFAVYHVGLSLWLFVFGSAKQKGRATLSLALVGLGAVLIASIILSDWTYYRGIWYATLNKTSGDSFAERSYANMIAVRIFMDSAGIGVGLGAHRSSGLIYNMMAAFGLPGMIIFGYFVLRGIMRATRMAFGNDPRLRVQAIALASYAGAANLVAAIAGGNLSVPILYMPLLFIGVLWVKSREELGRVAPVETELPIVRRPRVQTFGSTPPPVGGRM